DETVERQGYAVVHDGPEAHGEGELEVPHRHLTGEEEGEWAGEEAQQEQRTTERLEHPGEPELGEQRRRAAIRRHADGEREQLHRAGQDEHERGHDAERAPQLRGPAGPLRDDVGCGHEVISSVVDRLVLRASFYRHDERGSANSTPLRDRCLAPALPPPSLSHPLRPPPPRPPPPAPLPPPRPPAPPPARPPPPP